MAIRLRKTNAQKIVAARKRAVNRPAEGLEIGKDVDDTEAPIQNAWNPNRVNRY